MKKVSKIEALELAVIGMEDLLSGVDEPKNENDMLMVNKFWTALTITKAQLSAMRHEMVERSKKLSDVNKGEKK